MSPLVIGALLLAGSSLFETVKQNKIYNEKISEENEELNKTLEKKRLLYLKSGLKLTGSVLDDINDTRDKGYKNIKKLQNDKNNMMISSLLGMPFKVKSYMDSGREMGL